MFRAAIEASKDYPRGAHTIIDRLCPWELPAAAACPKVTVTF